MTAKRAKVPETVWCVEDWHFGKPFARHFCRTRKAAEERIRYCRAYDKGQPWEPNWEYRLSRYERATP